MPQHDLGILVENEWQSILVAVLIALMVGVGFGIAQSPTAPWLPYEAAIYDAKRNDNRQNIQGQDQSEPGPVTATPQEFIGQLQADPNYCYRGEKQGECAARMVQDRVARFYEWLIGTAIGQLIIASLMWSVYRRQRDIMDRQLQAMVSIESPLLMMGQVKLVSYRDADDPTGEDAVGNEVPAFCRILVGLVNAGRSPAPLINFCLEWEISSSAARRPHYRPGHVQPYNNLLDPMSHVITFFGVEHPNNPLVLSADNRSRMSRGERLRVYGYFSYRNIMGEVFDLGFLAEWVPNRGLVMDTTDQSYAYHRKRAN
jgi:hypothetical protein